MSEVKNRLSLLEPEEYIRLNEALNCYIQECNYSTVAMSVSAVESRLFSLLMKKDPNLKLEKLTLGQLIREYLDNKEKYGNIVPEKHEDLLQLFNTYRVLSIHPKREKIPRPVVTAIINMTLAFLFDEELRLNEKTNLKS